ncbi:hypothetical protein I7I50_11584 [Histoplasma capsulatum G186AR]|uniref:Uncharacterized protein n=1 Tax=Ajellomyces capsulatus TaxID=5037 RepID=A0A8H7Z948_AJECA|nr:hypothetical protein I7I52_02821 [Histoplasma capsulatum]QSS70076.1 hypothetical protein I7I50_11584 [Histoplasma capsulatum G186AR]
MAIACILRYFTYQVEDQAYNSFLAETVVYSTLPFQAPTERRGLFNMTDIIAHVHRYQQLPIHYV